MPPTSSKSTRSTCALLLPSVSASYSPSNSSANRTCERTFGPAESGGSSAVPCAGSGGDDADKGDEDGSNGGGAAFSGISITGYGYNGDAKILQLGKVKVPWDELTSWHEPLLGLENNFLDPFGDLDGTDFRN